jgi:histidine triad (HIT) family protein
METCLFCAIAAGRIPSRQAFSDEAVVAFHDIDPQAPTHILLIPRRHVASLADLTAADAGLLEHLATTAARLARELGLETAGYRLVINCGEAAGQTVPHLHLHLLAGRRLGWPPG